MKLSVALRACSAGGLMPLSVARVAGMPSHRLASPLVRQCPFIPVGTGLYDANDVELLRVTGRCWLPADDGGHALQCLMTRALVDLPGRDQPRDAAHGPCPGLGDPFGQGVPGHA